MKSLTEELAQCLLDERTEKNVLLVEDNDNDAELSTDELKEWGCHVERAWNGATAIAMVRHQGYDVAIIDLRLPDYSGLEVAERIKEIRPIIVVFICTGIMIDEKIMSDAVKLGYVIFPKPLRMEHFASLSRTLCTIR